MLNPATVDPRQSEFTLELIRRSKNSNNGCVPVRLRDDTVINVIYVSDMYISHGDFYDMSRFESKGDDHQPHHSWTLSGFNTYPTNHQLDIMEIIE